MKNKLILLSVSLFAYHCSFCQTTSEWRGIGRTGVYNEKGLLQSWPEKGPDLLWSAGDMPKGNSSVSISNNTIYLTGMKDTNEYLIALEMKGSLKWKIAYGHSWNNSFPESRSTPTIDNNKVYVTSGMGELVCMDASSGSIIWKVNACEKFHGAFGNWGIAESPLVVDNKVFITVGGDQTTTVALDKNNGETIWVTESIHDRPSYVSPMIIEKAGKKIITAVTEKNIIGINASDGKILWIFDYGQYAKDNKNIQANTPLFYKNGIFVTNGYDHKSVMLKLADDASSVSLTWIDSVMDVHIGGAVRIGEYIYGSNWIGNGNGHWTCLDWNTGKVMYEKEWFNKGPIIANEGFLYCYEEKTGNIALVKATPEKFEVTSSFKIKMGSGPHWAHPVINNGILYIRHGDVLMAYDIRQK